MSIIYISPVATCSVSVFAMLGTCKCSVMGPAYPVGCFFCCPINVYALKLPRIMSVMPLNHDPTYVRTHSRRPNYKSNNNNKSVSKF